MRSLLCLLVVACSTPSSSDLVIDHLDPGSARNTAPVQVRIEGSGFHFPIVSDLDNGRSRAGDMTISIGDVPLDNAVWKGEGLIEGMIPMGLPVGPHPVTVRLGDRIGVLPDGYVVLGDAPPDAGVTPACARLALGSDHTCVLRSDSNVYCWGQDGFGELGGTGWPAAVALGQAAVSLGSRAYTTCAALADGTVRCWGMNDQGQVGDGGAIGGTRPVPVTVNGMTGAVDVITGRGHACARRANGSLRCWGNNASGQLGDGTTISQPSAVSDVINLPAIAGIAAGGSHTCAYAASGMAWCWGDNGYMQLGDGTTTNQTQPLAMPVTGVQQTGPASFRSVDGQFVGAHTCALVGGQVWCWGDNAHGQLGNATTQDSATPVMVSGLNDAVEIAMGRWHVCALRAGGTVVCWGRNLDGEVGDGTTTTKSAPVAVPDLLGVVHIATGGYHTCALEDDGQLFCWGANARGQLGDGTTIRRLSPVASHAICP